MATSAPRDFVHTVFVPALSVLAALLAMQPAVAMTKSDEGTITPITKDWCGGQCDDGYWSHDLTFQEGEDISCGPVAAAALLADIGCLTLQGRIDVKFSLPPWGTHPGTMAELINSHIDRGDGCEQVTYGDVYFEDRSAYFNWLRLVTRNGWPVAALIKGSEKNLHWVVIGDVGGVGGHECAVTYYDGGYRIRVTCGDFGDLAERGYVWPFVAGFTVVLPIR